MQFQSLKTPPSAQCGSFSSFVSIHHFHHQQQQNKIGFSGKRELGFACSVKRVFKSQFSVRNHGGFSAIRCGAKAAAMDKDDDEGDRFYMRRCVELARSAIGCTSPNPMVGCVIVKDGKVVGQGFHPKAGQPHAEVFALRDAGDLAENATAYVSLEPCNHFGRTPPCSEALIKAKVKRVVVGMVDPNPIVASKGVDRLRDAGIDVVVGVEEESCKKLNEAYIHQMLTGKPFLTLRYSISVNGQFLDELGDGVTESGGYYSQLLQEYDALILSPTTSTGDFLIPKSEENGANQPLRIIISRTQSTQIQESDKIIIFSDKEMHIEPKTAKKAIETVLLDRISLDAILEYCKRQGFCSVLLDLRGGFDNLEELVKEGIEQNLLQKIVVEVLPIWAKSDDLSSNILAVIKNVEERVRVKNLQPGNCKGQSVVLEGYL